MPPKRSKKVSTSTKTSSTRSSRTSSPAPPPPEAISLLPLPSTSSTPLPPSEFTLLRTSFRTSLNSLYQTLKSRRFDQLSSDALTEEEARVFVEGLMAGLGGESGTGTGTGETEEGQGQGEEEKKKKKEKEEIARKDLRKAVVERGVEEVLMDAATLPTTDDASSNPAYYLLSDLLDLTLTFSELGYAESTLPLICAGNLMELQTIYGCLKVFEWIESRGSRITKEMHPQKGKGPLLLRLLNELLRRLPKSTPSHVISSGRILMYLSSVFPLGEKSGVNLRGNFNKFKEVGVEDDEEGEGKGKDGEEKGGMEVEKEDGEEKEEEERKSLEAFYPTFWSLQKSFINPPSLFPSPSSASHPSTPNPNATTPSLATSNFDSLRKSLEETLRVFRNETRREKEVSGNGIGNKGGEGEGKGKGKKKDWEGMEVEEKFGEGEGERERENGGMEHYFFPKFLTSKGLLSLEIADPQFRRQILIQSLILFQYLLSLTSSEREKATLLPLTNLSVQPSFVLPQNEAKWIEEMRGEVWKEMESMEGGRKFKEVVEGVLRREENWTNWKLKSCLPFERPSLDVEKESEKAQKAFLSQTRRPMPFKFKMGNWTLSDLWKRNLESLEGFVPDKKDTDFDTLAFDWEMNQRSIEIKEKEKETLEKQAASSSGAGKLAEIERELESLRLISDSLSWRAFRAASTTHFKLLEKSKSGEVDLLLKAIEEERIKNERIANGGVAQSEAGTSEMAEEKEEREKDVVVMVEDVDASKVEVATTETGTGTEDVKMDEEVVTVEETEEKKVEEKEKTVEEKVEVIATASPKRPREPSDEDVSMEESESKKRKVEGVAVEP